MVILYKLGIRISIYVGGGCILRTGGCTFFICINGKALMFISLQILIEYDYLKNAVKSGLPELPNRCLICDYLRHFSRFLFWKMIKKRLLRIPLAIVFLFMQSFYRKSGDESDLFCMNYNCAHHVQSLYFFALKIRLIL